MHEALGKIDWGSVPAWVGSILSGASVLLALSIVLRDRLMRERAQAAMLACHWLKLSGNSFSGWELPYRYRVDLFNSSQSVFVEPLVIGTPRAKEERARRRAGEVHSNPSMFNQHRGTYLWGDGSLLPVCLVYRTTYSNEDDSPGVATLAPGDKAHMDVPLLFPSDLYEWAVHFTDSEGRRWRRNMTDQSLTRVKGSAFDPRTSFVY